MQSLVAAHDLDNLATIGPFRVDIDDQLRHDSLHVDSTQEVDPAALARVATLLQCPALADQKDVKLLGALAGAVDRARSAQ